MVNCDIQVVVLAAGRGSRMTELTSGTPKCLLPVGGKPILCHVIDALQASFFKDVIIVTLEDESSEIQKTLSFHNFNINYELVTVPSDSEDWGTADSVRHLIAQDKIKNDLLILSCDLFSNVRFREFLYIFWKHRASFAAMFFLPVQCEHFQVPGYKAKYKPEKDIVGIDLDTSRLLFLASASDFEENVSISMNILKRHPKLSLRTDLLDGHIYVMSYKLAKYLATEKKFGTLKGEFFPYIVSKQHIRNKMCNDESSVVNESKKKTLLDFMYETKLEESINQMSTYNDHDGDLEGAYHGDVLKCYAVLNDKVFGIRINSLQALCQANRLCTDNEGLVKGVLFGPKVHPSASLESTQVDAVSFVHAGTKIKEKTSVKTSVIGENCVINSRTRLSRCIIMKNAEIEEGCVLDNCIVGNNAKIRTNCELKNCLVGPSFEVASGTKANDQVLIKSEGLMEI